MNSRCASTDAFVFFRAWSRKPLRVASIVPSGRSLGRLITQELDGDCGTVIEPGPGTGVFTRAIITRGVAEQDLVLVETGREFVGMLSRRFPRATILEADAAQLGSFEIVGPVGAVVSGLPLLSMPTNQVEAIMSGAFKHLDSDGSFYQFTYGPRCPVPRKTLTLLGLEAEIVGRAAELPTRVCLPDIPKAAVDERCSHASPAHRNPSVRKPHPIGPFSVASRCPGVWRDPFLPSPYVGEFSFDIHYHFVFL